MEQNTPPTENTDKDTPDAPLGRTATGESDTNDEGDFATEHNDTTVGEGPHGPGLAGKETESPRGLGGMDLPDS